MVEKLFLYWKGYVIVELSEASKERFLNLCKNKEIEIFQIIQMNDTFYAKMSCKDYRSIRQIVKKTHCIPKIKGKRGLPFFLTKINKRKGLCIGICLSALFIWQLSERIWGVHVSGGFLHTKQELTQFMEQELQVYGGIAAKEVDCAELEKKIRLKYKDIGWISVEKRGCNLFVRLNESVMPQSREKTEVPCHIIAERDGTVKKIEVLSGVPMVQAGDKVQAGDVLISGIVPVTGDYEVLFYEPKGAIGAVWLETEFTYTAVLQNYYEEKIPEKKKIGLELFLFQKKLFSYIPRYSDGKYDIMSSDIVPFVFEDFKAPFLIRIYRLNRYRLEQKEYDTTEVERIAGEVYQRFLLDWEKQGAIITEQEFSVQTGKQICKAQGNGTVCGNFISYRVIEEKEWKTENEYNGNKP